ncbi:MAG TPA: lamin tail domain-containing protein, partial [Methylomirabilota bacterium]|nr:lamin tail domain-containing protein [Methylomirabilota bacterium]
ATVVMPGAVHVGLAACSRAAGQPVTARFRDYAPVTDPGSAPVELNLEPPGPSRRTTPFAITELMLHRGNTPADTNLAFVELYNSNPFPEEIGGYRLTGEIDFTFPEGLHIPGNAFVVVARNPAALAAATGLSGVLGPFTNAPARAGTIRLRNKENAVLLEIPYSLDNPWPIGADGTGHSLVLNRPSYGEAFPQAWAISAEIGGSPGRWETPRLGGLYAVVINEFLARTEPPQQDYVELYNHSAQAVDISGCSLSDEAATNKFVVPPDTIIPPRGFVVFDQAQLGFGLSAGGETVYLRAPGGAVLDAVQFEAQAEGVSAGRFPDGAREFYPLANRTPGASNDAIRIDDIVINEIMYKPISGDSDDEFVELYNQGMAPVNLGGWRFVAGIDYAFPSNAVIAPGGYLVVARNLERLRQNHPTLNATNSVGNFDGSLANRGERLALARPELNISTNSQGEVRTNTVYVVVDEVTYINGGQWGQWANGGGSSLELIDPRSNHRLAHNWADSDETAKAPWTSIEATGVIDNGAESANNVQIMTLNEGECLVDDIEVIGPGGANLLAAANSNFEGGLGQWTARGDHYRSTNSLATGFAGYDSAQALHIRASARGDSIINRLRCMLTAAIPEGSTATIRAKVRWLRGWPELVIRTHGNWMEAYGRMTVPANLGTPGARNSRALTNNAPAIYEVAHHPVIPEANQDAVVTARVHDPDGVTALILKYRIDPSPVQTAVAMRDDGTGGDAIAGDGVFSGIIPGQAAGRLAAFQVEATDRWNATRVFPPQDASYLRPFECLVRFGDPIVATSFGTYRQWLTTNNVSDWINRPVMSNERIFGTFVYGNFRAIYNMSSKYSGSPYHQGFSSPVNAGCHYSIELPLDDLFLGTENLNKVHAPGNGPFDDAAVQREQFCYGIARQLGLPWNYRRFVNMFVNGNRRGGTTSLMEDTQTPGGDVIESFFPDDDEGNLYKLQPWFETDDAATGAVNFRNNRWCALTRFTTPLSNGVVHDLGAYRHNYLVRAADSTANDFQPVFDLINAANTPTNGWEAFNTAMEAVANMEQWMRIFAVHHSVGDWDHFGSQNSQNMYGWRPRGGKWSLMIWDMNIVLNNSGSWGPGQNLFLVNSQDAIMPRLYQSPKFRRMYLRALREICLSAFETNRVNRILDAKYAAMLASGITPENPATSVKPFINSARVSILNAVRAEDAAAFSLTSSNEVTTDANRVTVTGEAPVDVATIWINGVEYPVTWRSVKAWAAQVVVTDPDTVLHIEGRDRAGQPVSGAQATVTIHYTGTADAPEDSLTFSEIMYNPAAPDAEYIEIHNRSATTAFDLGGWRVNGLDLVFPPHTVVTNGQYLVAARNPGAFSFAYGVAAATVVFNGRLDGGGETLTLERPTQVITTNGPNVTTNIVWVAVDKVKYDDDLPWSRQADGGGPSLQVIDEARDNSRVSNWAGRQGWTRVSRTGNILNATNLLMGLQTAGSAYLDDVTLTDTNGQNIILNGGFETGDTASWIIPANYGESIVTDAVSHSGRYSLLIRGSGSYQNLATAIQHRLADRVALSNLYTLTFWILPETNSAQVNVRTVPGNNFNTNGVARAVNGSPGAPNLFPDTLPAYDPVWLNEIQVLHDAGATDNAGEREPWLELYNAGTNVVDLSGYYLADNYTNNLLQWQFPAEASIGPGEFKLVWLDGEPGEATADHWHASFRLSSPTGSVALVRMVEGQPQITDYLNYGLGPNLSYGSAPDGQPFNRVVLFHPTPGATNVTRNVNLFINEWMAGNTNFLRDPADGDWDDWFEIYNAGEEAVDLAGYYLTDSLTSPTRYKIPGPGRYLVPPGGFLLVWADNETTQNDASVADLHAGFALSRDGEAIGLFAPDGITVIDAVSFNGQTNDVSEGRYADGADTRYFMTTPTPRQPNTLGPGANSAPT